MENTMIEIQSIQEIIIRSQNFDEKNKELIKNEGVVFTKQSTCNIIINKLNPSIKDKICEPSVGKGSFVFALLEIFRKKGESLDDIVFFIENNLYCFDINIAFINEFKFLLDNYIRLIGYNDHLNVKNILCGDYLLQDNNYDITLGNPPYVRIQNLNKEYLDKIKGDLKSVTLGNIDLYYAFIEKALKSSGKIGFIIPNSFIKTKSGFVLRQIIKNKVSYIYDFCSEKVWSNISTYTCILICGENTNIINYETSKINLIKNKLTLSDDAWVFTEQNTGKNNLNDLINYCSGPIATIKDDVFKMEKSDDHFCYKKNYKIEKELCKKIIKATKDRNIDDYKWIIYPYDDNSKILKEDYIKENYPNGYNYLLSRKEELIGRDKGKIEKYDSWYAYGRRQGLLRKMDGIRIILPLTFLRSRGIHYIEIPNGSFLNLSGILLDIKKDKFDEFIKAISSEEFYNFCETNNKILSDKNKSDDIWLSLTTTSLKKFIF